MNHYDVRSIYSSDAGRALSRKLDENLLQVGILAARASATVSGGNGGTVIESANADDTPADLIAALFDAAQALDEKDVPAEDRFAFLKPAQYYMLVENGGTALSTDYNPQGNGSFAAGKIFRIAGIELVKSNNIPSTDVATGPTAYQGDFTNTVAVVWHKSAVGTVKLIDLGVESAYDIRRQGTLVVAKYALGSGILRPESAVEITTDDGNP